MNVLMALMCVIKLLTLSRIFFYNSIRASKISARFVRGASKPSLFRQMTYPPCFQHPLNLTSSRSSNTRLSIFPLKTHELVYGIKEQCGWRSCRCRAHIRGKCWGLIHWRSLRYLWLRPSFRKSFLTLSWKWEPPGELYKSSVHKRVISLH